MATIGGVDMSSLFDSIGRGVGDLIGGFTPETDNAALAGLGQQLRGPDLFAGLDYGGNPTAFQVPQTHPFAATQGQLGGPDLFADLNYGGAGDGLWQGAQQGLQGPDLFGQFQASRQRAAESEAERKAAEAAVGSVLHPITTGATGADPATDKWRDLIDQAAAQYGIDGDAIQAIMMIESGGDQGARSGAGAVGLMQVMPFHWDPGTPEAAMFDPRENIFKGASILADNYKKYGNWDSAVAAYLGAVDASGNPTTATDMYGTSGIAYAQKFNENLRRIKEARSRRQQAGNAGGAGMASIWGGGNAPISQEFGPTAYSGAHSDTYDYGATYGVTGHTGLDIGIPRGTQLRSPVAGTVVIAGTGGYFRDEDYGDNGQSGQRGEIMIQLDDGTQIILGHTSQISVTAGQRVNAGDLVGLSGSANGDHLHLEVRVVDRSLPSGYRIVDPRSYFGGGQ